MSYIKLNSTTPPAPAGARNVHFRQEGGHSGTASDPIPTSAYYERETGTIALTVDGGASPPPTGSKGFTPSLPFAGTITKWELLADQVGSLQVTIKKCTFATFPTGAPIVASAPPAIVSAQKASSSTLTGWNTALAVGDILEFVLDSISQINRFVLKLEIMKG